MTCATSTNASEGPKHLELHSKKTGDHISHQSAGNDHVSTVQTVLVTSVYLLGEWDFYFLCNLIWVPACLKNVNSILHTRSADYLDPFQLRVHTTFPVQKQIKESHWRNPQKGRRVPEQKTRAHLRKQSEKPLQSWFCTKWFITN